MPEKLTYSEKDQLITVLSTGVVTTDEVRHTIRELASISKEKNINKVIVDQLEATSFPINVPNFNLGSDAAYLLKGMKIAIIPSEAIKYNMEFFEQVAQARGGKIQVFESKDSAINWLEAK